MGRVILSWQRSLTQYASPAVDVEACSYVLCMVSIRFVPVGLMPLSNPFKPRRALVGGCLLDCYL